MSFDCEIIFFVWVLLVGRMKADKFSLMRVNFSPARSKWTSSRSCQMTGRILGLRSPKRLGEHVVSFAFLMCLGCCVRNTPCRLELPLHVISRTEAFAEFACKLPNKPYLSGTLIVMTTFFSQPQQTSLIHVALSVSSRHPDHKQPKRIGPQKRTEMWHQTRRSKS